MTYKVYAGLAAGMLGIAFASAAASAATLDDVQERGALRCGVAPNAPGFAAPDNEGVVRGFDVDFCRAIAAAVLGDAAKHETMPLGLRDGFTTLATGGVDVLTHRFTWTFNRDNGTGLEFMTPYYYDGQGFMVRKELGIGSVNDLEGATICVAQGSTSELNIADHFGSRNMTYQIATFAELDEARNAYEEGRCDAWSNDRGTIAARSQGLKDPSAHMILPETISKEPIAPMVRMNDGEWAHVVRWTLAAVVAAEELDVTTHNVDEMKERSNHPEVRRLLGVDENLGEQLKLPADWAYQAIKQVGNYGEIFARNIGEETPLGLERGLNRLWKDGGLIIAPPFR
jgi:general L-amino acid transport system substrate-binding protein